MVELSKHQYNTLVYWANRGYKHDGKAYREKYPKRKDPWDKINKSINVLKHIPMPWDILK